MSDHCCQKKSSELKKLAKQQGKVLWIVLSINAVMFGIELLAGVWSNSLALTGDSLDMLGDAIAYGSSLYVINMGSKAQARSAVLKGGIMFLSAVVVFARAVYQLALSTPPELRVMSGVGVIALCANLICLYFLTRHRNDNINMSSVWLCSRNDIIANTSVLGAAGLVYLTHSPLPDIAVGVFLAFVFARSAGSVLSESWQQLKSA
ncbi:MAG: cation transporter [Tildeniella nuda ZEHNDER 1965/U140]|jgi:cation diffusion facilitator family transporter|nr:cation transporter [Tildeniella nuda ZEHNDER 1965/U140]